MGQRGGLSQEDLEQELHVVLREEDHHEEGVVLHQDQGGLRVDRQGGHLQEQEDHHEEEVVLHQDQGGLRVDHKGDLLVGLR